MSLSENEGDSLTSVADWAAERARRADFRKRVDLKQRFLLIARGIALTQNDSYPQKSRIEALEYALTHSFKEYADQTGKINSRASEAEAQSEAVRNIKLCLADWMPIRTPDEVFSQLSLVQAEVLEGQAMSVAYLAGKKDEARVATKTAPFPPQVEEGFPHFRFQKIVARLVLTVEAVHRFWGSGDAQETRPRSSQGNWKSGSLK